MIQQGKETTDLISLSLCMVDENGELNSSNKGW